MAITRLLSPWRGPNVKRFSACIARFCSGIWELEVSLPFLARAICAHSADATTANASAGASFWNLERMGERSGSHYSFSGALKQPTIINPNLGKSCWRGGYASRNLGEAVRDSYRDPRRKAAKNLDRATRRRRRGS